MHLGRERGWFKIKSLKTASWPTKVTNHVKPLVKLFIVL
jgi:hypothetical protein